MYNLQLKIAIEALAKEYLKIQETAKENPPVVVPPQSAKEQISPEKAEEKAKQKRKEDFIEELNRSGKYYLLKEKLKKQLLELQGNKTRI